MSNGFTGIAGSLEEDGVLAGWGTLSQLVQGDDLTTGLEDSGTSSLGDGQSGDGQFGNVKQTHIVGDGANHNSDLFLSGLAAHLGSQSSKRKWRAVDLAHKQTLEDDLVELAASSASQESVQLDQKQEVGILALGRCAADLAVVLVVDVNTHFKSGWRK